MTTPNTLPPGALELVRQLSRQLAQHTATTASPDDLSHLLAALDGKTNSTIIVFAAVALKQIADDMSKDDERPADFTPEMVAPILIATINELLHNMTLIRTPIAPKDIH